MSFKVPEAFRITRGGLATNKSSHGNNGAFRLQLKKGQTAFAIASDGMGWEHVSVSRRDRCLNWEEMCEVKHLFWGDDDWVMQFHPPASEYVNNDQYCLHLWRPTDVDFKVPNSMLVGIKNTNNK